MSSSADLRDRALGDVKRCREILGALLFHPGRRTVASVADREEYERLVSRARSFATTAAHDLEIAAEQDEENEALDQSFGGAA